MVKTRAVHTIALNEDEEARLQQVLIEGNFSIMDIFRAGLNWAEMKMEEK